MLTHLRVITVVLILLATLHLILTLTQQGLAIDSHGSTRHLRDERVSKWYFLLWCSKDKCTCKRTVLRILVHLECCASASRLLQQLYWLPSFLSPFNSDVSPLILTDDHFIALLLLLTKSNWSTTYITWFSWTWWLKCKHTLLLVKLATPSK